MLRKINSMTELIASLGGGSGLTAILGLKSRTHGDVMRHRRMIPVSYWPAIIEAAGERGIKVTTDDLMRFFFAEKMERKNATDQRAHQADRSNGEGRRTRKGNRRSRSSATRDSQKHSSDSP